MPVLSQSPQSVPLPAPHDLRTRLCHDRGVRVARLAACGVVLGLAACGGGEHHHMAAAPAPPAPQPPTTSPPPATTAPPPAPARVAMSFRDAGAFVWHADAIDPAVLGQELRSNGFGWAAI